MRLLFFGTPEFAVPVVESLIYAGHEIAGVATQPDRPQGRRLLLTPPPVKTFALQRRLPVFQPEKINAAEFVAHVRKIKPELIVVAAFGQIFKKELLTLPKWGCWNVHASILPRYRGASPIVRCLMAGETETGVSIMQMGEGLDDGDVLSVIRFPISPEETAGELEQKLAQAGGQLLLETIQQLQQGKLRPQPQDSSLATYASKIKKEEGEIRWDQPADMIHNLIRALNPAPGAHTFWRGERLLLWCSQLADSSSGKPGEVVRVDGKTVWVKAGDRALALTELQLPGKKAMGVADFLRGHPLEKGERLGGEAAY